MELWCWLLKRGGGHAKVYEGIRCGLDHTPTRDKELLRLGGGSEQRLAGVHSLWFYPRGPRSRGPRRPEEPLKARSLMHGGGLIAGRCLRLPATLPSPWLWICVPWLANAAICPGIRCSIHCGALPACRHGAHGGGRTPCPQGSCPSAFSSNSILLFRLTVNDLQPSLQSGLCDLEGLLHVTHRLCSLPLFLLEAQKAPRYTWLLFSLSVCFGLQQQPLRIGQQRLRPGKLQCGLLLEGTAADDAMHVVVQNTIQLGLPRVHWIPCLDLTVMEPGDCQENARVPRWGVFTALTVCHRERTWLPAGLDGEPIGHLLQGVPWALVHPRCDPRGLRPQAILVLLFCLLKHLELMLSVCSMDILLPAFLMDEVVRLHVPEILGLHLEGHFEVLILHNPLGALAFPGSSGNGLGHIL
mmetsp:Transcript_29051/g.52196  ORF Transcript_29051/g.52196 Transcript_29051/m.52196 type:complete len:412 (-) Transcript_29051:920-2155(-)